MALEIDIEYRGGALFDIETRVEVCDLDISESMTSNPETTSVDEVASDLLEGIEQYRNQLKFSEETAEKVDAKNEGNPKIGWFHDCFLVTFVTPFMFFFKTTNYQQKSRKLLSVGSGHIKSTHRKTS